MEQIYAYVTDFLIFIGVFAVFYNLMGLVTPMILSVITQKRVIRTGSIAVPVMTLTFMDREISDELWTSEKPADEIMRGTADTPIEYILFWSVIIGVVIGFLVVAYFQGESAYMILVWIVLFLLAGNLYSILLEIKASKKIEDDFLVFLDMLYNKIATYRALNPAIQSIKSEYLKLYVKRGEKSPLYKNRVLRRFIYYAVSQHNKSSVYVLASFFAEIAEWVPEANIVASSLKDSTNADAETITNLILNVAKDVNEKIILKRYEEISTFSENSEMLMMLFLFTPFVLPMMALLPAMSPNAVSTFMK